MQYENVFKSDSVVHVILALLKVLLMLKTALKMAPGTGTGAPQMDQRLLTITWPKQGTTISIQSNTSKN